MISKASLIVKYICVVAVVICCSSCSKDMGHPERKVHPRDIRLFIEMSRSVNTFEHVEPSLYTALWNHFRRVGFDLTSSKDSFRLVSVVRKFDTGEKLVSPDVLPYNFKIHIDVECTLYDSRGKNLARKIFTFNSWASRPRDVRFTSHYNYAEFQRVFERFVPRIDHYFRRYFTHEL